MARSRDVVAFLPDECTRLISTRTLNQADRTRRIGGDEIRLFQILTYLAFFIPLSIVIGEDVVSVNYLFALLLVPPLIAQARHKRNTEASAYLLFMIVSFLLGVLIYSHFDQQFISRQLISFGLMLMGVLLLFVRLDVRLEEFLVTTVVAAVLYSVFAIYMFATESFSLTDIYFIKEGMREYVPDWPQRYVMVLLFGFFVSLGRWPRGIRWSCACVVILACVFLTFTRSAWLGIICGLITFTVVSGSPAGAADATRRRRGTLYKYTGAAIVVGLLVYAFRDEPVVTAFSVLTQSVSAILQTDSGALDPGSSSGARLEYWSMILDILKANPFSGTGFASIYLITHGPGSAHSQYMDVLLRTGIVGLGFYLWFWKRLFIFYRRVDRGVVAGLAALFVFGLFQETTKYSYGALIFFVLLNKTYLHTHFTAQSVTRRPCRLGSAEGQNILKAIVATRTSGLPDA